MTEKHTKAAKAQVGDDARAVGGAQCPCCPGPWTWIWILLSDQWYLNRWATGSGLY